MNARFYRWWPTIATSLAGLIFIVGGGLFFGYAIHDHDLSIIVSFLFGILAAYCVGGAVLLVYWRRNP